MNLQPLIDNLHWIIAAFGLLLWAAAWFVGRKAAADPKHDKWDEWAPKLQWASGMYSQAIDWLCDAGHLKFKGQDKLKELNRLTHQFEEAILTGNYREAIDAVIGYYTAAKMKKLEKISANPSIGPDDPAVPWDTQTR